MALQYIDGVEVEVLDPKRLVGLIPAQSSDAEIEAMARRMIDPRAGSD